MVEHPCGTSISQFTHFVTEDVYVRSSAESCSEGSRESPPVSLFVFQPACPHGQVKQGAGMAGSGLGQRVVERSVRPPRGIARKESALAESERR